MIELMICFFVLVAMQLGIETTVLDFQDRLPKSTNNKTTTAKIETPTPQKKK